MNHKVSRRNFLKIASTTGLSALPSSLIKGDEKEKELALNVVCIGAHPDDPESGCAGTLAKLSGNGHKVKVLYLTRGEAGVAGKSTSEAAKVRSAEAEAACKVLNAEALFLGQHDGNTLVNQTWISKMTEFLSDVKPHIVFTHWPLDTHPDHQIASMLTVQAWARTQEKFELYFYEVCAGEQTMLFHPTDYVDISNEREIKRKAIYCHATQDPASIYACGHQIMETFRGAEIGVQAAEAFICLKGRNSPSLALLSQRS